MRILLDGNIYDKLVNDLDLIAKIRLLVAEGKLTIICNQVVERELRLSPHQGIPDWFPVEKIHEPGAFIGYALIAPDSVDAEDERYAKIMPEVSVYSRHRGASKQSSDAIIADTASRKCDYIVSEDQRLIRRMGPQGQAGVKSITFAEFERLVEAESA